MESGGEGRPARPGQVAFQKFDNGLPGGDAKANQPKPLPQSQEQQFYRELLGGFFAKLTRWQTLLADDQFLRKGINEDIEVRSLDVITTPAGSLIVPRKSMEGVLPLKPMEQEDLILRLSSNQWSVPEYNHSNQRFIIAPGQAGRQKLVDLNGQPLKPVDIEVVKSGILYPDSQEYAYWLSIRTEVEEAAYDPHLGYYTQLKVEYDERHGELTRSLSTKGQKLMPDAYASHVFTAIDTLIPDTVGGSPQSTEKPTPQLPTPGR